MPMFFRALLGLLTVYCAATGCSKPGEPATAAALQPAPQSVPEPPAPPADPVEPLRAALQAMVAAQQYEDDVAPIAPPLAGPTLPPASAESVEAVRAEVAGLRQEIADLRSELNEYLEELVQGLQSENQRLRDELVRLSARPEPAEAERPRIPSPGDSFVDDVVEQGSVSASEPPEPETPEPPEPAAIEPEPEPAGPVAPFVFTSVKEWGRSPEASKGTAGAASLFGMVGTVPRDSREADLMALGKKLRAQYDPYDNINIEVFDSAEAARKYAERREVDPEHHVLSVSRHAASGRDTILLFRGGAPIDVTVAPQTASTPPAE